MEIKLDLEEVYMIQEFYDEIETSINNNTSINIKNTAKKLASFCLSEKFIPILFGKKNLDALYNVIAIYELNEKYLSLKILFYLLEELKDERFVNIIKKIFRKKENPPEDLEKIRESYINKNKDSINNFKNSKRGELIIKYIQKFKRSYLYELYECMFRIEILHKILKIL